MDAINLDDNQEFHFFVRKPYRVVVLHETTGVDIFANIKNFLQEHTECQDYKILLNIIDGVETATIYYHNET